MGCRRGVAGFPTQQNRAYKEAALVGGLFFRDFDFIIGAVGNLKAHHKHLEPVYPFIGGPRRASRAKGARKMEGPLRYPSKRNATALKSALLMPLSLRVGRSLLQAERSGSESRRGSQGYELGGTAVVAASAAPITTPGLRPEANDHLANIRLAGRFC